MLFVICDPDMLSTLPAAEAVNGLAEVVKHGAIGDPDLFSYLEEFSESARTLERPAVERMVSASVTLKAGVVRRDELEAGERRILNFGHTVGHGLEKATGMSHGEAVSVGMVAASRLSVLRGRMAAGESDRIEALLADLGLPVRSGADPRQLMEAIGKDKKREGGKIHFVFLRRIGEAVVEPVALEELGGMLEEAFPKGG